MSTPNKDKGLNFLVVIDGPAGGGKSSLCHMVGERLGLKLLDTGAIYRCFAYHMDKVGDLEAAISRFKFDVASNGDLVSNQGKVGEEIRTQEISDLSSRLSSIPRVREALLPFQRDAIKDGSWIAEGRDLGSIVFPNADLKIYLDAHPSIRALRRYRDLKDKGLGSDYKTIHESLLRRDKRDLLRRFSPLTRTLDAIYLDTSLLLQEAVEDLLVAIISKKL